MRNTAEIGLFKIVSESGVAAGIRRIEAVAGAAVLPYLNERDAVVKQLGERFKAQPGEIIERVSALQDELKATGKALAAAQAELAVAKSAALASKAVAVGNFQLLVERLDGVDGTGLQGAAQSLADQLGDGGAVVIGGLPDPADQGKVILVAAFGKDVIAAKLQAGKFIGGIAKLRRRRWWASQPGSGWWQRSLGASWRARWGFKAWMRHWPQLMRRAVNLLFRNLGK